MSEFIRCALVSSIPDVDLVGVVVVVVAVVGNNRLIDFVFKLPSSGKRQVTEARARCFVYSAGIRIAFHYT